MSEGLVDLSESEVDDVLMQAPRLRWVQLHSAGIDHLLGQPIMNSEVIITTVSGIHATPIAEYAFASMLAWSCRVPKMLHFQNRREWPQGRWNLFVGQEVRGATLGIVGYGSIGREVARIGKCFGMRVVATKRSVGQARDTGYKLPGTGDPEAQMPDQIYPPQELQEMLAECDFVVISLPLTPETQDLIGILNGLGLVIPPGHGLVIIALTPVPQPDTYDKADAQQQQD